MEKKVIDLEIKSNVEESIAGLKALKRQLKDTAAGSAEFKALYNQIDDLEDKIKSSKNASSDWVDSLESAGGPLGALGGALNRAKVATQSFGGALKATGIGLIVGLIGGLVGAFKENEGAMKKLQPLLDGVGKLFQGVFRAVEPLFNTLVDLAVSALPMVSKAMSTVYSSVTAVFQSLGMLGSAVKKLISGDFSGAFKDAKASVNDFGKNYDASVKRFESGSKEMTAAEKEQAEKRKEAREKEAEKAKALREKQAQEIAEQRKKDLADLKAFEEDVLKNQQQMNLDKYYQEMQDNIDEKDRKQKSLEDITLMVDALDDKNLATKKAKTDKDKQDEIDAEKRKNEAIANSRANLNNIIAGLESSGLAKTKAGQAISKAIALTQIGIDSAVAISKASTLANAEGIAAQLAFPTVPGIGTIARVVSYASTAASVIGNIARARQLLSGGGGGGGAPSSGGGGGGASGGGSQPPAFNVVGASPTSQLAQTIGNQQQQPIKSYVVSKDVTSQQALDRNIVQSATIG